MGSIELIFRLTRESKCPYYDVGEVFKLSGNAVFLKIEGENTCISTAVVRFPSSKNICRTLVGDLTRILMQYENVDKVPTMEIECSSCEGSVRLKYAKEKRVPPAFSKWLPATNMEIATHLLRDFSIFKSLDENQLREIIPLLKFQKYPKGSIIIKRGDPAQNLFIILTGVVEVLDENSNSLSRLQKGDVFGEMGLISGDFVGATVKVSEPAAIALIKGEDFRFVLGKHASIQTYLTRLLAKRLADSNLSRAGEIASVMSGNLSELSLAEVLQSLHLA